MFSFTPIFIAMLTAKMTSNSGVFRFDPNAAHGEPIFNYYAENKEQCLRACYDESNCTVVQYKEDDNYCRLYKEGTGKIGAYVLSREATSSSCMTEIATTDIHFQKIPKRHENVSKMKCANTQNVTVIEPYKREGRYWFFVPQSLRKANNWNSTDFKFRLIFSNKPEETCTSVPVFHKADYRRLYFGEIYNATGYYFHNAYAFTDYCVTPAGECLGVQEIREYVDKNGDFFYDDANEIFKDKNIKDSNLGQTFFIVEKKPY